LYDSMKENITTFRKAHKSVIENIIPDVLVWTWGFDISEFLGWNIAHNKEVIRREKLDS
jgi:hypothetical protein